MIGISFRFKIILICIAAAITAVLVGCASIPPLPKTIAEIPSRNLTNYDFDPLVPLSNRVRKAPDFLLSYLREMDKTENYSPYVPTKEELAELRRYLDLLPPGFRRTLQERLIGVYFINHWIGSGMTDYVLGNGNKIYTILIINPETMRHNISRWVSYRESTCFLNNGAADREIKIGIDCGTEYSGLMYVLLHESSHIMDYVHHFTPYVEEGMQKLGQSVPETKFVKNIWKAYDLPLESADYKLRKEVSFYGLGRGPQIHAAQANALYRDLAETPFVSLYGSQNWAEDFAEYCTWYYFTTRLKQPYRIIISRKGTDETVLEPLKSERVRRRLNIITDTISPSNIKRSTGLQTR